MSLCNPCTKANNLPACVDTIVVGRILYFNKLVYVYVKNHTTDAPPIRFNSTSDEDGYVEFDLDMFEPMPNHSYSIWITLRTARNMECKEDIQPADCDYIYTTDSYTCFSVKFDYIDDSDLMKLYFTEATLTLAD